MIHWATVLQRSEEMSFKLNLLKLPKCQNQGLSRIKCSAQLRCEFPIWKVIRHIFLGHIISSPTLLPTFFALSLRLTIFVFFFLAVDFDFVLGESKTKVWNRGPKEICVARKCVFYWTQVLFWWWDNLTPRTIWHLGQFDTNHARRTIWHLGQFDT